MKVDNITLRPDLLITTKEADEVSSDSGIILAENTDDFLIHATVVNSSSDKYKKDDEVIFHVVDALSFRETHKVYYVVEDSRVLGTYEKE